MKMAAILPAILVISSVVGIIYLLCNAPDFADRVGSPQEYAADYRKINNAEVAVVSASKDSESRRWKYKCRIQGCDTVLTMAPTKSPYHPRTLIAGHTYKLDYRYDYNLGSGRILLVHGEVK
jgi:hypothetical protein